MDPQPTTLRPELPTYLELSAAVRFFDAHAVPERAWRRSPHPEMTVD